MSKLFEPVENDAAEPPKETTEAFGEELPF